MIKVVVLPIAALLTACSNTSSNEPLQQATAAHIQPRAAMSSAATADCISAGGTPAFARQLDGSQLGTCQLANGRRCSESALLDGRCAHF